MPAQQGPRRDEQAQLTQMAMGQQPGLPGQDRAVRPRQARSLDLALEHRDLVGGPGGAIPPGPPTTVTPSGRARR